MKVFYNLLGLCTLVCLSSCEIKHEVKYEAVDYSDFKFYELPMGDQPVGFHTEMHWDETRAFKGMDKRPLLIGMWYPANLSEGSRQLQYKDYLLANMPHDGVPISDTTMNALKEGFVEGAENFFSVNEAAALRVMDLPVRAFDETEIKPGKHPLLLYAASFNAGIHENSAIFEYLASHGYVVAAIASVGNEAPGMSADSLGIAAQLADFELLHKTMTAREYVDTDKVATSGFSWGGFATTLMGIDKGANLMISMDGSQTYFPQAVAQYQATYDKPAQGAYLQFGQRMPTDAQFNQDTMVYHWIGQSADAYLYRFKAMDHRDFGGAFQYLHALSNDSAFRAGQAQRFTEVYSKDEKGDGYIKTAEMMLQALNAYLLGDEKEKNALIEQSGLPFTVKRSHSPQ